MSYLENHKKELCQSQHRNEVISVYSLRSINHWSQLRTTFHMPEKSNRRKLQLVRCKLPNKKIFQFPFFISNVLINFFYWFLKFSGQWYVYQLALKNAQPSSGVFSDIFLCNHYNFLNLGNNVNMVQNYTYFSYKPLFIYQFIFE